MMNGLQQFVILRTFLSMRVLIKKRVLAAVQSEYNFLLLLHITTIISFSYSISNGLFTEILFYLILVR